MKKVGLGVILVLIAILVLGLFWGKLFKMEDSLPADNRSGDYCPKCKSTDVCRFLYGRQYMDSVIVEKVRNHEIIPGGCVLGSNNPRYKCNKCSYIWGNYVDFIKHLKEKDEEKEGGKR